MSDHQIHSPLLRHSTKATLFTKKRMAIRSTVALWAIAEERRKISSGIGKESDGLGTKWDRRALDVRSSIILSNRRIFFFHTAINEEKVHSSLLRPDRQAPIPTISSDI